LTAFSGCGQVPQKVKLELKFFEGQQLTYEMTSEQQITVDSPEPASDSSRSKGEMVQEVIEVLDDGSARIRESSSWSWSEQREDGSVDVVSSSESLTYRIAPSGKISEFEILSNDNASQWQEYAQSKLEQSQPTFPDEAVAAGYTWMQTVKIFKPSGEALDATTTYRVSEFIEVDGRRCAVIDYEGNLVLPFDVVESDSLARKGVDKVDLEGTIWFDYDHGCLFSQHEKTRVTAERAKILPSEAKTYTAYIDGELFLSLATAK
jgi:hypothetical protein